MEIKTSRTIERLTTSYDSSEDRISISGEVGGGEVVLLWLTQRLARRLVAALVNWLERTAGNGPMPELRLEMAQQAAEASLTPQPPVQATERAAEHLLSEVNLSFSDDTVHLEFKWPEADSAGLTFSDSALRQWLAIVRRSFELAEWPLDCWPEWSLSDTRASSHPAPSHLH